MDSSGVLGFILASIIFSFLFVLILGSLCYELRILILHIAFIVVLVSLFNLNFLAPAGLNNKDFSEPITNIFFVMKSFFVCVCQEKNKNNCQIYITAGK